MDPLIHLIVYTLKCRIRGDMIEVSKSCTVCMTAVLHQNHSVT